MKSDIYTIYITESGNVNGIPVMCLHGGPGIPMGEKFRKVWDPKKFRVFTFHQRGCGKSEPRNCLKRNKTRDHFRDIEKIRKKFGIKKWIVEGGSWGATLAVLYAINYPKRVIHLIPFGISLMDGRWEESGRVMAPDVYYKLRGNTKNDKTMMDLYMKKLQGKDKLKWARKWNVEQKLFEIMSFRKMNGRKMLTNPEDEVTLALYECYYYKNRAFMPKDYILKNAHKLNKIPGHLVHGRFDIICSPEGAYRLSQKWKKGKFIITEMSGHSWGDPNSFKTMSKIAKECKKYYKKRKSYYEG